MNTEVAITLNSKDGKPIHKFFASSSDTFVISDEDLANVCSFNTKENLLCGGCILYGQSFLFSGTDEKSSPLLSKICFLNQELRLLTGRQLPISASEMSKIELVIRCVGENSNASLKTQTELKKMVVLISSVAPSPHSYIFVNLTGLDSFLSFLLIGTVKMLGIHRCIFYSPHKDLPSFFDETGTASSKEKPRTLELLVVPSYLAGAGLLSLFFFAPLSNTSVNLVIYCLGILCLALSSYSLWLKRRAFASKNGHVSFTASSFCCVSSFLFSLIFIAKGLSERAIIYSLIVFVSFVVLGVQNLLERSAGCKTTGQVH